MKFEDRIPKIEVAEVNGPGSPKVNAIDLHPLAHEINAAAKEVGVEEVEAVLDLVAKGKASPEALLAWIDDLRIPVKGAENKPQVDDSQQEEGYQLDFIADSQFAGGAVDTPMPSTPVDTSGDQPSGAEDADYFFSATRKKNLAEDGVSEEDGETPVVEGVDKAAPKKK